MTGKVAERPVLAGIDGSAAALYAARWSAAEAVGRGVPLRLMYVTKSESTHRPSSQEYELDVARGKLALEEARKTIAGADTPVSVETELALGDPAGVLIAESRDASLICLGSTGIGRMAAMMCGSTAAAVAEHALCSVAVVRPGPREWPDDTRIWTVAPVSAFWDNDDVVTTAIEESKIRHSATLVVGVQEARTKATSVETLNDLVNAWQPGDHAVHLYPVATSEAIDQFLDRHPELRCQVIIPSHDAGRIAGLLGGHHPLEERVVIVTRPAHPAAPESELFAHSSERLAGR